MKQTEKLAASDKSSNEYYVKSRRCPPLTLLDVRFNKNLTNHLLNALSVWPGGLWRSFKTLVRLMARTLAPLRRIVSRDLEVIAFRHNSEVPQSFIVHDHLECGHVQACLTWDIFDLLNAYTDNPEVSARRHRCHPCASLLATRKPVQSVALAAKAGVA